MNVSVNVGAVSEYENGISRAAQLPRSMRAAYFLDDGKVVATTGCVTTTTTVEVDGNNSPCYTSLASEHGGRHSFN